MLPLIPYSISEFLPCKTPETWIVAALEHPDILLIDHANCERKAATTALSLMHKYLGHSSLLYKMSRLAREELRHFEQVLGIMEERDISYVPLSASRYAGALRQLVCNNEPEKLIDTLIISSFIEARSCERFAALAPHVDRQLKKFYTGLLASESRHFADYLQLAREFAGVDITERIATIAHSEQELIESPDTEFRFHSGPPGSTVGRDKRQGE